MKYKTPLSALLPSQLMEEVDGYKEEYNLSRTQAVEELLEAGLARWKDTNEEDHEAF